MSKQKTIGAVDLSDMPISGLFGGRDDIAKSALGEIWSRRVKLLNARSIEDIRRLGKTVTDEIPKIESKIEEAQAAQ